MLFNVSAKVFSLSNESSRPLRIENFNVEEDDNSSTVSISVASHWADFEKQKGRKTNTGSQKLHFPNDVGFDYASQAIQDIKWGRA